MAMTDEYCMAQLRQACPGANVACIPTSPQAEGLCVGCDRYNEPERQVTSDAPTAYR